MKEWTYIGTWQVTEDYLIKVDHKVLAINEQLAAERAFKWFMGYHKKSIPFRAHYIGMRLESVKDV